MQAIFEKDITEYAGGFVGIGVSHGSNQAESDEELASSRRRLQWFDQPCELSVSVQCARAPDGDEEEEEEEDLDYFYDDEEDELDDDDDLDDDLDDEDEDDSDDDDF